MRCLNQSSNCRLTLVRRRPVTFFVHVTELAKELANRIRLRAHTGYVLQGGCQFRHRDVAILHDDFCKEAAMRLKLSLPSGAALRRGSGLPGMSDRQSPTCSRGRRKLQAQRRRTPAQSLLN